MRQVNSNPTNNKRISLDTYSFTATGASGTVTGTGVSALERGQSIFLDLTGGSSVGYSDEAEYFVIPVDSTHFRIAATKQDALRGNFISGASGDAGAGTVYPNINVGGVVYIGVGGDVNIRGINNKDTGVNSFTLHKNTADGMVLPFMIKDISTSGTTATDIAAWCD